jgi:hypothetical protein
MRMLRCLLVSGSAAVIAGGLMVTAGAAATQRPVAHAARQPSQYHQRSQQLPDHDAGCHQDIPAGR